MSFSKAKHLYSETSVIRVESCLISLILLIEIVFPEVDGRIKLIVVEFGDQPHQSKGSS